MKEIEYKLLGVDDLELLVKIRIKDLKMFSNQKIISDLFFNTLGGIAGGIIYFLVQT